MDLLVDHEVESLELLEKSVGLVTNDSLMEVATLELLHDIVDVSLALHVDRVTDLNFTFESELAKIPGFFVNLDRNLNE